MHAALGCSVLLLSETGERALLSYLTFHVTERRTQYPVSSNTWSYFCHRKCLSITMDTGDVSFRNIQILNRGHTAREW